MARCHANSCLSLVEMPRVFKDVPDVVRHRMSRIRKENSRPELVVRRLVHRLGYRFRLHRRDIFGCPDLVLPRHRSIVFVHGCFWHQHKGCCLGKMPQSRLEYWKPKLGQNVERDKDVLRTLRKSGWRVLVIWECETREIEKLQQRLRKFLG